MWLIEYAKHAGDSDYPSPPLCAPSRFAAVSRLHVRPAFASSSGNSTPDCERSRPRRGLPAAGRQRYVGFVFVSRPSAPRPSRIPAAPCYPGHALLPRPSRIPAAPCYPGRALLSRPRHAVPASPCCPGHAVLSRPSPAGTRSWPLRPPRPGRHQRRPAQAGIPAPSSCRHGSARCPGFVRPRRRRVSRPARSAGYAPRLFPLCLCRMTEG
jgi:hypothetical protein